MLSYVNGSPVSIGHGLAWVDWLGHLLAYLGVMPIVSAYLPYLNNNTAPPITYPLLYVRTPAARSLFVELLIAGGGDNAFASVEVTASSGTLGWIVQAGLDGTTDLATSSVNTRRERVVRAYIDVTGLPVGELVELDITITDGTNISGTYYIAGIRRITAWEVPLAATGPVGDPEGEVGIDASWMDPSQPIIEGADDEARGIKRIVSQLELARTGWRRHFQSPRPDDGTSDLAPYTDSTDFVHVGRIRLRAQRLRADGSPDQYAFAVVYKTDDGTTELEMRVTVIDTGDNFDFIFPASTSRTFAIGDGLVPIPCDTTDQEVDVNIAFRVGFGSGGVTVFNRLLFTSHT